jgi:hypothetical protein
MNNRENCAWFVPAVFVLAVVGAFTVPSSAFAHCEGKHTGDHPHCAGGGGGGSGGSGVVASVEIVESDAIGNAITLHWITPITPEGGSEVASYEVRYSETPLDESNFETATLFERDPGISTPALDPGMPEYRTIRGLDIDTTYYIGVRAVDAEGSVSELNTPGSFASATTQSTARPSTGWQVDTVAELAPDNCCSTTSAPFDSSGNPIVAWVQHHGGSNTSGRVWYGYQNGSGNWVTEEVFVAGLCQRCFQRPLHDFRTIPVGPPGMDAPSNPALLFNYTVSVKGNLKWNEVVAYAYRQDTGGWITEDVVQGGRRQVGAIGGESSQFSLEFFYKDDAWVPTAAYFTPTRYNDPYTTNALILAERQEIVGQAATWNKTPALECDEIDSSSARMQDVRLRRGHDGSLHAMVQMHNDDGAWALIMHRKSDGTWEYQRTGLIDTFDFAVDSTGKYYVAGVASEALYGQEMLFLMEQFDPISGAEACVAPNALVTAYDIADHIGATDVFANNVSEGPFATVNGSRTFGLYLTGDDGQSSPDVHIFQMPYVGDYIQNEARVLSRCAPGTWINDTADRMHEDGYDSGNFAVSDSGIAWAYNYGRSDAPYGWNNDPPDTETMFVAKRTGNACQFAN